MDASNQYVVNDETDIIEGVGSSHLAPLDQSTGGTKVRNHIQGMTNVHAFRGLVVMKQQYPKNSSSLVPHPRANHKTQQLQALKHKMRATSAIEILWVALSNDWKFFLSQNNHLLPMAPNAEKVWKEMTCEQKVNYHFKSKLLLTRESVQYIKNRLQDYELQLLEIFGNSKIETIYHSSILERKHKYFPHLDMYFCVLNSILFHKIKQMTRETRIFNVHKIPIKFVFINVSEQFHSNLPNTFDRTNELRTGFITHRSRQALESLTKLYNEKINKSRTLTKSSN